MSHPQPGHYQRQQRERRRAPRVEERLPLTIAVPQQALTASSRNLSSSGVYCELERALPVMTRVALTIELPARSVRCRGVVVRSEAVSDARDSAARYRIAVFFTRLGARDRQAIARFVAERLAAQQRSASTVPARPLGRLRAALWLMGTLTVLGPTAGCHAHLYLSRGGNTKAMVDELGTTAEEGQAYTFRWLQRQFDDFYTYLRFDGLVVDMQGRRIDVVRQQDGNHVLLLRPDHSEPAASPPQAPPRSAALKVQAKDLPTLQAVVRRYRFEPQLIIDAIGAPQLVVYAPVPTRVSVIHEPRRNEVRVEVRRLIGQPSRTLMEGPAGSSGGSQL